MANFAMTGFIKLSPQEIFDYIAEPANLPKWQANTEHAEWISTGQPGVGSTFKVVTINGGKKSEAVMQITVWDPPNQHGFKSIEIPFPIESIIGITTLTPKQDGTEMRLEGQVETQGIFKLLAGLITSQVKKQDTSNFDALREQLEAG